jgi:hypothetical protein
MAKQEPLYTAGKNENCTTTMKSSMEIPQKTRDKTAIWSSDTTPDPASTQKNAKQHTIETPVQQCSLQHYSQ